MKGTITKDTISKEVILKSNIESVWNAITKQEEISAWFLNADFKAEEGYQYTFTTPDERCIPIRGVVKKADPYTLVYTWIVDDTKVETTVQWKLEVVEGGTKLNLEHSGISNYPDDSAIKMFESFNGGWDNCISGLTKYL